MRSYRGTIIIYCIISFLLLSGIIAQEEENASLYLEAYTDEFQNNFFEGLKQKSIGNFDKAANLFLKCKQLDETSSVVDFQLADCYAKNKQFLIAQPYAISAVTAFPDNYWYLNLLEHIMQEQGLTIRNMDNPVLQNDVQLKKNLILIYFRKAKFEEAKNILDEMNDSAFKQEYLERINDSIGSTKEVGADNLEKQEMVEESPLDLYKKDIEALLNKGSDAMSLLNIAETAIEEYPTQPLFYYAKGVALNQVGKGKDAAAVLELGLGFILDDQQMENSYYKELSKAYNLLGNASKANMYLSKIKSGS